MHSASFDVYSLGFSNRTWEATVGILRDFEIELVADIRTLPGSRHTPQFNKEHLEQALPKVGVEYIHVKSLGGLRKSKLGDSINAGWKNASFRAYADYMQTEEFCVALDQLRRMFTQKTALYACSEAVFWRCHRSLVSDALLIRGYRVGHIFEAGKCEEHRLTSFARVDGPRITYPAPDSGDPVLSSSG